MAVPTITINGDGTTTYAFGSGALGAITGGSFEDAGGIGIQCTAISGATVTVSLSNDGGTTKTDALLIPVGSATGVVSFAATGAWRVDTSGFTQVWVTSTAGTCTIIVRTYRG